MAGFLIGWWLIAAYVPPPHPDRPAAAVAGWYAHHTTSLRFGL